MKRLSHILLALSLLFAAVGCSNRGKVIPASTMAEIYADILISDKWLRDHPEYTADADTTLFYDPIFRRYGYTFEDYDTSLKHYIKDPTRLYKIFRKTSDILKKSQEEHIQRRDLLEQILKDMDHSGGFNTVDFLRDSLVWRNYDTLIFRMLDSLSRDSVIRQRMLADTLKTVTTEAASTSRDTVVRDELECEMEIEELPVEDTMPVKKKNLFVKY